MNQFSNEELEQIKAMAAEGFFDEIPSVCSRDEKVGVRLLNPFRSQKEFIDYKSNNHATLPKWIRECEDLSEFYAVLVELNGLLNGQRAKGQLKDFMRAYERAKSAPVE